MAYQFRVVSPDAHLGLVPDEILVVSPGEPAALRVAWPRPRSLAPNFGYLAGLLAEGGVVPVRGARLIQLIDASQASTAPPKPLAFPPRRPARSTTGSASAP